MLEQFDVRGDGVYDDETGEVVVEPEPMRHLLRFAPDGTEVFAYARVNIPLLQVARDLTLVELAPVAHADELMADGLLNANGSHRSYVYLELLCDALKESGSPARYLAETHTRGGRRFYFTTEAPEELVELATSVSAETSVGHRVLALADLASVIMPTELMGHLGFTPPAPTGRRLFGFWGNPGPAIESLGSALRQRGYEVYSSVPQLGELKVIKEVPLDEAGFLEVLQEVIGLSHARGCRYMGTETIDGGEQFRVGEPIPPRYAGGGAKQKKGFFGRRSSD